MDDFVNIVVRIVSIVLYVAAAVALFLAYIIIDSGASFEIYPVMKYGMIMICYMLFWIAKMEIFVSLIIKCKNGLRQMADCIFMSAIQLMEVIGLVWLAIMACNMYGADFTSIKLIIIAVVHYCAQLAAWIYICKSKKDLMYFPFVVLSALSAFWMSSIFAGVG